LVHLYHNSSLLPSPLPIVASAGLTLLYSFLYSEHINHIQAFDFLPYPNPPLHSSSVSRSNNITAFVLGL
jgi:hypothetical protein